MADEKDDDADGSMHSDGIHYSMSIGAGNAYSQQVAQAQDELSARMYDSNAKAEREEEKKRINAARAKTERLNRDRAEALQAEREAQAVANAESIKDRWRRRFSGQMTSADFEQWWKSNKLRLIEEDMREQESVFLREATSGEFGTM
jgi:hypothetical protein